jgi:hypothetical protein
MQGWDYITNRAEKTYVRIGPGAFSSVAYLYSVVMHEYRHVLQRQSLANQETESRLRAAGLKSINEVEAYALEQLNATESGIKDLPERVASVWASLVDEYGQLDTPEKRKARPLAERARARAQAMIRGSSETLAPLPTP